MKKFFSLVLCLLLFLCPLGAQAEDVEPMPQEQIVEAPLPDPMSDEAIRYLQGEEMYQGTLSWQGNKANTKFNKVRLLPITTHECHKSRDLYLV